MGAEDTAERMRGAAAARVPGGGIARRRVSQRAYERALVTEGPHIATAEGEAWWRDQERRYPEMLCDGKRPDGTDSPNGRRCRHGKVSYRYIPGKGRFVWRDGGWRPLFTAAAQPGAERC